MARASTTKIARVASDIVSIMRKASAAGRTRLKRIVRIGTHRRWPKRDANRQEWSALLDSTFSCGEGSCGGGVIRASGGQNTRVEHASGRPGSSGGWLAAV